MLIGRLLTLAVTHSGVVDMLRFDKKMTLMRMVSSADRLPPAVQVTLAKTVSNCPCYFVYTFLIRKSKIWVPVFGVVDEFCLSLFLFC